MSTNKGSKRLARILKLIPFLQRNPGIEVKDAAALFGLTEEQLISDLNLIWMCGLPGYTHLELIDVSYDSGFITIQNAQTLNRPMRITFDEGAALLLAIENLTAIAPKSDASILAGLREKIANLLAIKIDHPQSLGAHQETVLPELISAINNRDCQVSIDYYSATLDDTIRRTILPTEITTLNGFAYLSGFVADEGRRLFFRIDRIQGVTKAPLPSGQDSRDEDPAPPSPPLTATVRIQADGYWFIQKWRLPGLVFDATLNAFVGQVLVYNPKWMERAAMSALGAITIQAPDQLRTQVVDAARRTLERYGYPVK